MAVTNADILGWLNANPGASPALINQTMAEAGVSAAQYQSATGAPPPPVAQAVAPQGMLSAPSAPAVSNADILGWFNANPNASDALIAKTMQEAGVTPTRLAEVTGAPAADVAVRYATALSPTVTDYQGKAYDTATILKLAQQITPAIDPNAVRGGAFKTSGESIGFNYDEASKILGKAPTAAEQVVLDMARHLAQEGVTDLSQVDASTTNRRFGSTYTGGGGTIYEIKKDDAGNPVISTWGKTTNDNKAILGALAIAGLAFGIPGLSEGLLSGGSATTAGLTAAEAAGLGLTAAEASALGLSAAEFAAAGGLGAGFTAAGLPSGVGTFLGENVVSGVPAFDAAFTSAGGLFNPAFGLPVGNGAFLGEGVPTGIPASDAAFLNAGGVFNPAYLPPVIPAGGLPPVVPTGGVPTVVPPVTPPTGLPPSITTPLVNAGVNSVLGGGSNLSNLFSGGLGLTGGVLQQQQSREAAQTAAQNVDKATQQAVEASQFRPVGMTTRFGTSNYTYDPVTGRMTSAGYQLSPDAKAAQDRLVGLAGRGLTQAEAAQQQFAPLQTGAQSLFGLGNQYISQSPQDVAQNYINQQMALLQPSREVELANLQNRLQQQGRAGLSVAQGGSLGATTPELQALYNARAQQEAVLAANAQQAGQQNVLFGAGLLGQGAQAMGNYYGGQQAAYAPYTTALGQVQNLESLAQQPLQMGASLGQQSATAGANAGRIGLTGAQISGNLMTSNAVTNNPYAAFLSGLGSPTSTLGQGLANYITGYNPIADQNAVLNPYFTPTSVWNG